jgi:hypothetical protein
LRLLPRVDRLRWVSSLRRDRHEIKEHGLEAVERVARIEREARWHRWL